jgi:head-tail adaptor
MIEAGKLVTPISLMYRTDGDDGYGNTVPGMGPWTALFTTAADKRTIRGSEQVIGARLTGVQYVEFWTRYRPEFTARPITTAWLVKTPRDGWNWDILLVEIDPRRRWVKITAKSTTLA